MLDLSETTLDSKYLEELIDTLYNKAGLPKGQNMTFDYFKKIFASDEYEKTLEKATLGLQGNYVHLLQSEISVRCFNSRI